jgi:DNA repair photolyase
LSTMKKCKEAGLYVGMNCIPVLPFISDTDEKLAELIDAGKSNRADYILIGGLTLFGDNPADSKILYRKFLERKFHHMIAEYKKLYRVFPYPPQEYIAKLNHRADVLCQGAGLKRGIL